MGKTVGYVSGGKRCTPVLRRTIVEVRGTDSAKREQVT